MIGWTIKSPGIFERMFFVGHGTNIAPRLPLAPTSIERDAEEGIFEVTISHHNSNTRGNPLNKVTIYRFMVYDVTSDEFIKSRRWATIEAIERVRGEVLKDTSVEVDPSVLDSEVSGMTVRDFSPHSRAGFQQKVGEP